MKKILIIFFIFISGILNSQELVNFYLESNASTNSIQLHTKVLHYSGAGLNSIETESVDNLVTIKICYDISSTAMITYDEQEFTIDLPVGYNNYTFKILLYADLNGGLCEYNYFRDIGFIDFDFPYFDTATTYMPDDSFEEVIETLFEGDGTPNNDLVLTSRIENIRLLFFDLMGNITVPIQDLTGIDDFLELKYLRSHSSNTELTQIDFSNNLNLEILQIVGHLATTLDFSNNSNLRNLSCGGANLTDLNITNNSNLEHLSFSGDNVQSVDLSQNVNLKSLDFGNTQISEIDLSYNIQLEDLDCSNNVLASLDLSNNIYLEKLDCSENNLTELDLSSCILLQDVRCDSNPLTELEVSNLTYLMNLACGYDQITELDLSNNVYLKSFSSLFGDLVFVNIQNGYNQFIESFFTLYCYDLSCIQVDDSNAGYLGSWRIDPWTVFSENCSREETVEEVVNNEIRLYPNPVDDSFKVIANNNIEINRIVILDLVGNVVFEETEIFSDINVAFLQTGAYIINIETNNGIYKRKLIKKH